MTSSPQDHLLLRAAIDGDPSALDRVWTEHRGWVAAVLLAHAGASELDDLLQDVAVAVVRGIGRLEDPGAFRSWLRAVAVNAARSAARRRGLRPVVDGDPERQGTPVGAVPAPADRVAEERDQIASTLRHVAGLPVELREPLLLRALQGLSQREIAGVLGVPETTVETRLARARRRLRLAVTEAATGTAPLDHAWNRRTAR